MRIGLLRSIKVKSIQFHANEGRYFAMGDTTQLGEVESCVLRLKGSNVSITINGHEQSFDRVFIYQDSSNSSFQLKSISPSSKLHKYRDNIEVKAVSNRLNLVNQVDMNNYLAGVVESEGGGGRHIEYYKVQALMSRTYALKNVKRHEKEGFQLCDGVHCQAYHNMMRYTPRIQQAVVESAGKVLVDSRNKLVTSYFSANCGGQICDASHVWNNSVPYVESFIDTFCVHTRQATWSKKILKSKWKAFLETEYGVTEKQYGNLIYTFAQNERKAFFIHPSLGVPTRDLRRKFKLKSTFFSTHLEGDYVVVEGRGFGHGVGLCQEGAMNMAKSGYDYTQIARFYFYNVQVLDAVRLKFFDQGGGFH
jgi:stage II sporulation protein D